jgi:predicted lipoprotein with Yx(FWY)xxD motif
MRRLHSIARALGPSRLALVPLGLVAALAAGCGGATPSSNGGPAAVRLQSSKLGNILVDAKGHTLYLFERDERGESYCTGACASVWPPFETNAKPRAAGGVPASSLGTIKRDDGDIQVTYRGHPLYYYAADASVPGRSEGEDVDQFGAGWYVLGASGKAVEPHDTGGSSGNGNQGGGYR